MSKIKIKRGLEVNRPSYIPDIGELIITTDTKKLYFGSGSMSGGFDISASFADKATTALTASYLLGESTSSSAISASYAGTASIAMTASYISYTGVDTLGANWISSSAQVLNGSGVWSSSADLPVGVVSSSGQTVENLVGQNVELTTLTASAIQVDTLHVLTVTSSIVYSSGSNIFGSELTNTQQMTGSVQITGSLYVNGGIVGETSSYSTYAVSASHATTSDTSNTASYVTLAQTASYVIGAGTASFANTASFAITSATASYVTTSQTASFVSFQNVDNKPTLASSSAQLANNGGIAFSNISNVTFGEVSASIISASFVTASNMYVDTLTAAVTSMSIDNLSIVGLIQGTSSWAVNATTASYIAGNATSSYAISASYAEKSINSNTASFITYTNVKDITASSQFLGTASFASNSIYSGVNTINSNWVSSSAQILSGTNIVSSSAQTIANLGGTNIVSSSAQIVADLIGQTVSVLELTASSIQVDTLHVQTITSSIVYSSGSNAFGNNLSNVQQFTGSVQITGSLYVNNGLVGETSSYSTYAVTSSYSTSTLSASYATTAGLSISSSYISWAAVDKNTSDTFIGTASYASLAETASYIDGGTF
jgi:hypothetical protein